MLRLELPTDPRWVNIVEKNIDEILTDHAWCEQKAATNAITLITFNPNLSDLVTDMLCLAKEELEHFDRVHELIKKRGGVLGRERKDPYVNDLFQFLNKGGSRQEALVDRLLFSALIEARSCERFRVLSENLQDPELAQFYRELMESEAGHYTLFIGHARNYGGREKADNRWREWLDYEETIIKNYGNKQSIHG